MSTVQRLWARAAPSAARSRRGAAVSHARRVQVALKIERLRSILQPVGFLAPRVSLDLCSGLYSSSRVRTASLNIDALLDDRHAP
jgi:hypothetical protein